MLIMRYTFITLLTLLPFLLASQEFASTDDLQVDKMFIEATSERILGNFEDARVLFEQVLQNDPLHDAALYELSRVYDALGMKDEALDAIKDAIRLDPENSWYKVMQADILEKQENYPDAAAVYEELILHFPKQEYYYQHLIDLYKRMGQIRKALAVLEKYEGIAGIVEHIVRDEFDLYNQLGETEKALASLQRLVRTYPHEVDFLHMLATYCVQIGKQDLAKQYFEQILAMHPEDAKARLALARDYKQQGKDVDYLKSIRGLIANPSIELDAKIQELIPFTRHLMDKPDSSLASTLTDLTSILVKTHPDEAKSHALYADILSLAGNNSEARKEYEHTLVLDNSVFTVWEQLLYILADQKDYDALIKTADRALDVFPNQASVYYLSGLAHFGKRNYSEASSMLDHALIMTSEKPDLRLKVLLLLGEVNFEAGNQAKAVQAIDKALETAPQSYIVHQQAGYILARNGKDLKKAQTLAEKAEKIHPGLAQTSHLKALIAYKLHDNNAAKREAEEAIKRGFDKHPELNELYGDILFSNGEIDAAVNAWQTALESGSKNPLLPKKIEERKLVH